MPKYEFRQTILTVRLFLVYMHIKSSPKMCILFLNVFENVMVRSAYCWSTKQCIFQARSRLICWINYKTQPGYICCGLRSSWSLDWISIHNFWCLNPLSFADFALCAVEMFVSFFSVSARSTLSHSNWLICSPWTYQCLCLCVRSHSLARFCLCIHLFACLIACKSISVFIHLEFFCFFFWLEHTFEDAQNKNFNKPIHIDHIIKSFTLS